MNSRVDLSNEVFKFKVVLLSHIFNHLLFLAKVYLVLFKYLLMIQIKQFFSQLIHSASMFVVLTVNFEFLRENGDLLLHA
jgi:hypothetical protein